MSRLAAALLCSLALTLPPLCADSAAAAPPASQAAIADVLRQFDSDSRGDLRAVLVRRDGALLAERYYNGETADSLHDIRSAGKSITALLAGAAVASDRLQLQGRVAQYWPQLAGSPAGQVRLDDLLTMRSGLAAHDEDDDSPGNEDKLDAAPDPTAFVRSVPQTAAPGMQYRYNSLGSYIAGRVVENVSGSTLDAFAARVLFAPLGITHWQWGRDVAGHPKGQGNLSLRARDAAVIGQLVLDGGMYDGRRVLDAAWIEAALAPHVAIGEVDRYADSYGYFWYAKTHVIDGVPLRVHFASGNGGNKIYVIPARRMVVTVASSAYGKGYGQRRSEEILKAILSAR